MLIYPFISVSLKIGRCVSKITDLLHGISDVIEIWKIFRLSALDTFDFQQHFLPIPSFCHCLHHILDLFCALTISFSG